MKQNYEILSIVILLICALSLFSCNKIKDGDSLLDYTQTAERQFEEAMDEFDDEDCVTAETLFQDVRKQFPYSRFAVLSDLRLADCQFIQGNHAEAAIMYQQFVRTHPTHEEAHYAAYRRGLCYQEMIPGDWGVTPPPHERDQSATRDARAAVSQFIARYPRSPWQDRAKEILGDVVDDLVRHEMYVAEFYLHHEDRRAAAVRLEGIRSQFPESSMVPDAMFLQAVTFLELNEFENAERVFKEIIDYFPDHYQSQRAEEYINNLNSRLTGTKRGGDDG